MTVVTTSDGTRKGKPLIRTHVALDGDVLTAMDEAWLRQASPAAQAQLMAEHAASVETELDKVFAALRRFTDLLNRAIAAAAGVAGVVSVAGVVLASSGGPHGVAATLAATSARKAIPGLLAAVAVSAPVAYAGRRVLPWLAPRVAGLGWRWIGWPLLRRRLGA